MSELNDSDSSSCEWSLISNDGELEILNAVAENDSAKVVKTLKDDVPSSNTSEVCDEIQTMEPEKESKENSKSDDTGESDTSSDIEKIDEPPAIQTSIESSSNFSNFSDVNPLEYLSSSFLLGNNDMQIGPDTKSDASLEDSSLQILLNGERLRSYRHTPNQRLNIILNILLGLTVAAVIGLGIGHFIGWSNQWLHQRNLQQNHLSTLNLLEEELRACLQKQQEILIDNNLINLQPCYEKADHWKQQLNKMILNKNLDNLMSGSHNINQCNDEDNYRKLKSDFFHKQLEHIEAIKQFEHIKSEERKFRQKFKSLEDENNDLKIKLELEEEEDSEEKMILYFIMKENVKLRLTIDSLQHNLLQDIHQDSLFSGNKMEIGTLREQINQLQTENEDLRQVIARLRYSHALNSKVNEDIQNKFNQLETENIDLKMEIGKMRYSKPVDSSKFSFIKEGQEIDNLEKETDNAGASTGHSREDYSWLQTDNVVHDENSKNSPDEEPDNKLKFNISNYFNWIKDKLPWLDKDEMELLDTVINNTFSKHWLNESILPKEKLFLSINESLKNILNVLHNKWETIQNFSQKQPAKNKSFFDKVLSLWEQAKLKLMNAVVTSEMKLKEKPWNKFIQKMQTMISTIKKKLSRKSKNTQFESHEKNNENTNSFHSHDSKQDFSSKQKKGEYVDKNDPKDEKWKERPLKRGWKLGDDYSESKKWKKKSKFDKKRSIKEHDSNWIFKRAEFREKKKQKARQADWVFDRARDRAEQRHIQ